MVIKEKVIDIMKKYGTNDPYELCNLLGIHISKSKLGSINGFFIQVPKNKMIFLNSNLDDLKLKFVCAHELGHALLHSNLNTFFLQKNTLTIKGKYENQANEFAAELCIDDTLLEKYEGYSLETISKCTGIDIEYLNLKFNN